jgi:heat shock protein HslJ
VKRHRSRRTARQIPAWRLAAGVVGVLLLLAAACGDDAETTAAPNDTADEHAGDLEGTTWLLTADAPLGVALEAVGVSATFADGRLSGRSGCNNYSTTYQLEGDSITIGQDIATTLMSCPPAVTAVETAFLARLPRAAGFTIEGDILTMTDDQGEIILKFQAMNGAEAIQGQWTVVSYNAGDAVTSVVGGVTLSADFAADTVSGSTGCNNFHGPYEVDGSDITIGPLASTRAACPTDELRIQETNYLGALELARSFVVVDGRLDLLRDGGAYAVTLQSG